MDARKKVLEVTEEKWLRWCGHLERMPGNRVPWRTGTWESLKEGKTARKIDGCKTTYDWPWSGSKGTRNRGIIIIIIIIIIKLTLRSGVVLQKLTVTHILKIPECCRTLSFYSFVHTNSSLRPAQIRSFYHVLPKNASKAVPQCTVL